MHFAVVLAATLAGVIVRAKRQAGKPVKLIALLHKLVVRALSEGLPSAKVFVGETALNLRRLLSYKAFGPGTIGVAASLAYVTFLRAKIDSLGSILSDLV
jgi:hypothetical protein